MDLSIDQQLVVWTWVTGGLPVEVNRRITSPFRIDNHPSCALRRIDNTLVFFDQRGNPGHAFDCFHAVAYLCNRYRDGKLDRNWAKSFVMYHLVLGKIPVLQAMPVKLGRADGNKSSLQFVPKLINNQPGWTPADVTYWQSRGISSMQLEDEGRGGRVFSCSHFILGDSVIAAQSNCYAYTVGDKVKIYQPYADRGRKWFSSTTVSDYWLTKRHKPKLFITKSQKEHLISENLFKDYDVLSMLNEACFPEALPELLKQYSKSVAVFDEDAAGIGGLQKLKSQGVVTYLLDVPGCKDIDDCMVKHKPLKFKTL